MNRNFSLKHQMLLNNILIFVLPVLIIGAIIIFRFHERTREEIEYNNMIIATNIDNHINTNIQNPMKLMIHVREFLMDKDFAKNNDIDKYLGTIQNLYPYLDRIQIIDKDGIVKNVAPFDKDYIGNSMIYMDFFKNIDMTDKPVWSKVFISEQTHKPTVNISLHFNEMVLVGDLNLSLVTGIIKNIPMKEDGFISILDENGIYIADNNYENVSGRRTFDYFSNIKQGLKENNAMINLNSNEDFLIYSSKIKSTGWYSVIVMKADKLYEPVDRLKNIFLIGLVMFLILNFAISAISVNKITKYLKGLVYKTKLISSGDYNVEPETKGYTEFIELYHNFDIMKENIKEREERIQALSYRDQLTGLYNRRFYEEELKKLDVDESLPLTIVMADVNGLKLINDSFGHAVGDELLKKVSEIITKGCRKQDIVARLSGDEFVILLPNTDIYKAEEIVKNIKKLTLKEKVGSIDISISFGYETKYNEEEKIQEIFKKAEDHMYKKKLFESPSMRGKTINAIISTLHEKNKREEQHSYRVSQLCGSMGKALHLPEGQIEELKTVGLLHDIGKIAIEENILNKPDKLTGDEFEEIKRHPEIGYRILSTVNDMLEMAEYVLAHHERWDGNGYPRALKGMEIPIQARIITIVDAYDAMTSERSYRNALTEEIAVEELEKNAGSQFDPELIKVFVEKVLKNH